MILMRKVLRDMRAQIIGFGLGNVLMAFFVTLVFPSYSQQFADFEVPPAVKALIGEVPSFATAEGFLTVEFFSWIPVLIITYAIIQGTAALAGEEGAGTLDLLLSQPISRRRVVLEKALALTIGVSLVALVSLLGFALGMMRVALGISWGRLALAVAGMIPIALTFAALALGMSALLPNRAAAAVVTTAVAVASYFLNTLGQAVSALDPFRPLSVFNYYPGGRPLTEPMPWNDVALLMALSLVFLSGAVWCFQRRDISVGRREWSLGWRGPRRAADGERRAVPSPGSSFD